MPGRRIIKNRTGQRPGGALAGPGLRCGVVPHRISTLKGTGIDGSLNPFGTVARYADCAVCDDDDAGISDDDRAALILLAIAAYHGSLSNLILRDRFTGRFAPFCDLLRFDLLGIVTPPHT